MEKMSAISKSWSFVGPKKENKPEPKEQPMRVNLSRRFKTEVTITNEVTNNDVKSHSENVPAVGPQIGAMFNAPMPRRSMRKLPQGIAPLWNNFQDNVTQLKPQTSRALKQSGQKVNKTLQNVCTTISSFTQQFRRSTRRRYKLDGPTTPVQTPQRRTPRRTPGKLYSPFNFSTPMTPNSCRPPKRLQHGATPHRASGIENHAAHLKTPHGGGGIPKGRWTQFDSPSRSFELDVTSVSHGMEELGLVASDIVTRRVWKV